MACEISKMVDEPTETSILDYDTYVPCTVDILSRPLLSANRYLPMITAHHLDPSGDCDAEHVPPG